MLSGFDLVLVGLAALASGAVNALAGGGTLITFPRLTFLGVPAVAANMTNTVSLCPGCFGGTLASEADVYDLIETMSRVKWKTTGIPLITKQTKALLHYLRTLRSEGAHPGSSKRRSTISPREIATVIRETANQLWKDVTNSRAKFEPTTVIRDW